jgi:hypothetical protein
MIAARTGRIANPARVEHRLPDGLFAFNAGPPRAGGNCNGDLRSREVLYAGSEEMAFGLQGSHDLRRQHNDIRRFAGPHQLRRLDAAHGADIDLDRVSLLIVPSEISKDVSGRHR